MNEAGSSGPSSWNVKSHIARFQVNWNGSHGRETAPERTLRGQAMEGGQMSTGEKQQVRMHIRWMIRRDMPEVLRIEQASYDYPWCEEDFLRIGRAHV